MNNSKGLSVRIGIIDIGTVSTRSLLIEFNKSGDIISQEKSAQITSLGEGISKRKPVLKKKAIARTLQEVQRILEIFRTKQVDTVVCTLTSAARDAQNSEEILASLKSLQLDPQIIPGDMEAKLTFLGSTLAFKASNLLLIDIGGGSTEFALGESQADSEAQLDLSVSVNVGCRRLSEHVTKTNPYNVDELQRIQKQVKDDLIGVFQDIKAHIKNEDIFLVGVGGTVTSLVAIKEEMKVYNEKLVHGYKLTIDEITKLKNRLASMTIAQREHVSGLQEKRGPLIVPGILILEVIMEELNIDTISVSEFDLMQGLAYRSFRKFVI